MLNTQIENGKTIGRDREEWREGEREREREVEGRGRERERERADDSFSVWLARSQ